MMISKRPMRLIPFVPVRTRSVAVIAAEAAEQNQQHDDDQNQVHVIPR